MMMQVGGEYKKTEMWLDGWFEDEHGQQSDDGERCGIM